MTRKELEQRVQELADGTLSEQEFSSLQSELRENPASRAFYRQSMELELLLGEAVGVKLPLLDSGKRMEGVLRQRQRRYMGRALLAAAAVVVLTSLVLHQIFLKPADKSARIAFTSGTAWEGAAEGGRIEPGGLVKVEFGVAEIALPRGVRGVIEGPAQFRVGKENRLQLLQGQAWFRVEEEARGFQVRTPQVEVTDLGTEFGVKTGPDALDEVHVFEGRVAVDSRFGLKKRCELAAGQAAEVSPVGRWIERDPDPDRFFKQLPPSLPGIRFSFDGESPLRPEGVHPAVEGMRVERVGRGAPLLVEGVHGKALSVRGMDDVIATDWPGIGGADPRTIACWIRCEGDIDNYSPIVSWGSGGDEPGRCILMVAKSTRHVRPVLRFSLGHNVNFSGSTPLKAGRWYHVAVVFRGMRSFPHDMVELYVDGRREQVDPEFSRPPKEDQKIGTIINAPKSMPLRFGAGPYLRNSRTFQGQIDEVHILPRALAGQEVRGMMNLK